MTRITPYYSDYSLVSYTEFNRLVLFRGISLTKLRYIGKITGPKFPQYIWFMNIDKNLVLINNLVRSKVSVAGFNHLNINQCYRLVLDASTPLNVHAFKNTHMSGFTENHIGEFIFCDRADLEELGDDT